MQQQKLCLKWNNHTLNLLSVLETFQQKDILVDVTLSCEGHNIKAHKMILSACSPYFQNIFLENPCQHPIVIINGMKYEDITAILNFMYKGEVNVSHDGLSSFLQAAEALKVKGLAEVCGEKKSPGSGSQEPEQNEQTRPQRTETPTTKRRHRNRKRSLSDSNRSDDEAAPRKHKGSNSPEVHELSGDESYTGDMSSNGQNSRVPQNVYSRSHQSSSNITADEMDDEYEVEPSKMLEQTLTTDNANSASSDNSLRIERIMGNATEMESSSLHEPESPPDIKPIIEYGESSAGPSEGSMMVYNEQSQPGPSNMQDGSLLHDNSHTQELYKCDICTRVFTVEQAMLKHKQRHKPEGKRHSCKICPYSTKYSSHLRQHMFTHSGERPFKCTQCPAGFTQNFLLRKHMQTHKPKAEASESKQDDPKKDSPQQKHKSKKETNVIKNNKSTTEDNDLKKDEPKNETNMSNNNDSKTEDNEFKNEEPKNVTKEKKQESKKETKESMKHKSERENNVLKKEKPNPQIDTKDMHDTITETKDSTKEESKIETKQRKCERCSKTFEEEKLFSKHMKVHKREDKPYKCRTCFKRFPKESILKKHEKRHEKKLVDSVSTDEDS